MTDNPFPPWWQEPPTTRFQILSKAWDRARNGTTAFQRRSGAEALVTLAIPMLRKFPLVPDDTELETKVNVYWLRHELDDDVALTELLPLVDELTVLVRHGGIPR